MSDKSLTVKIMANWDGGYHQLASGYEISSLRLLTRARPTAAVSSDTSDETAARVLKALERFRTDEDFAKKMMVRAGIIDENGRFL
ncbi:hypothetical protein [Acidithiobacillus caldus]|jgi:hypothetical protein|uniref:Uncharacterized protein n=2 Tax=Acidithiobacillus caldus TaxID=33059 RepID=A0A059ZZ53_ACICK|nr:hypothetical protein [Acidithiobacillus caldus]AIA56728.1 hypothetical protein Acaty_m0155 [Acidithiobacillus caldus ATCC 51756]MBU2729784.1 hypothetical protein [Acidithiobacillus caldus]MBU2734298.1 hypothetical protein [Acidithiobacillus caldus ATCC 51756]MBU2745933.1 hypothetical protein [Acidithiobacillus caldus]MBU2781087.1 hypothetical protein [Acidithiobacillus caldus]